MNMRLVLLFVLVAGAAFAGKKDTNEEMLKELREIRASLNRIEARLGTSAMPTNLPVFGAWNAGRGSSAASTWERRGPDLDRLMHIQLPANATPDQVLSYIRSIQTASYDQNSFSSKDPQVGMLTDVGATNVFLLIQALSGRHGTGDYYLLAALEKLVDESSKPLVLQALPMQRELADIVVKQGWEADARETLIDGLANERDYLPTEWIEATANLKDPATYALLRDYLIRGINSYQTYNAIRHLPIPDMEGAVAEAWEKSRHGHDSTRKYMALVAVEYGHLDALELLINTLTDSSAESQWLAREGRSVILQHLPSRISNQELINWFRANRDNIRFDTATRMYVVDSAARSSEGP